MQHTLRVGIVGAGQLARMMVLAGYPLGIQFELLDPAVDACAGQIAPLTVAQFDDADALHALAQKVDVLTFDFENVPAVALQAIQIPIYPPPAALDIAQDRMSEKQLFAQLGIPTAIHYAIDDLADLQHAVSVTGFPAILKTRRLGYDGKGQAILRNDADILIAWEQLGNVPLILEAFVEFEREVSLIAARNQQGECAFYPLTENTHQNGILQQSLAPYLSATHQQKATSYMQQVLERLDYVGVLTIEFFVQGEQLIANEMAPRVHNSGHWTIEGAATSQFENHIRAICGLPLGDTSARACVAMRNFIGELPERRPYLAYAEAHYHDYGKSPRSGRKVGHATLLCRDAQAREVALKTLENR